MKEPRVGYMCSVDFDHELCEAAGGTKVFAAVKDLEETYPCVKQGCGIYKVKVEFLEVIREEDHDRMWGDDGDSISGTTESD